MSLYSDRVSGPPAAEHAELPATTASALLGYIKTLVDRDYLANAYPQRCQDGNTVCGTNQATYRANISALVPRLHPGRGATVPDDAIFDLLEIVGRDVAKPIAIKFHDFLRHSEYRFDRADGAAEFRDQVNEYLSRAGVMFRMTGSMIIERLGPESVRPTLAALAASTGDDRLDGLLAEARELYASRSPSTRAQAVERLWDAFERLKTLDGPGKRASLTAMLARIEPPQWRGQLEAEMTALTNLGNDFQIRHFETDRVALPAEAIDYLFARMGSLIALLRDSRNAPR